MSVESRLDEWLKQPGAFVTQLQRDFINDMRKYASRGIGYGWMQQVIEWEWQSQSIGAWGPEYFHKRIQELESNALQNSEGTK